MKPDDIPHSITAAELALLGPLGDPDAELPLASVEGDPASTDDVEEILFGKLADPEARRFIETEAQEVRFALQAGATKASLYKAGRVPVVGDEVIFRRRPGTVLKVRAPGEAKGPIDILQYHTGNPEAHAAVHHDRASGWSWLGEPPLPDPAPPDRLRAALAAGKPVPEVGAIVRLIRAKPRSYRGVEMVGLQARVLEQVDVVGDRFTLDLEVIDDLVDGLDPATASGIIRGVEGPEEALEGWARGGPPLRVIHPDQRDLATRPCDRCGGAPKHDQRVQFIGRTYHGHSHPVFAVMCVACADIYGRLAFIKPGSPAAGTSDLEPADPA